MASVITTNVAVSLIVAHSCFIFNRQFYAAFYPKANLAIILDAKTARPAFVVWFVVYGTILPVKFVVVGLGNPGEEYEGTRHNTGRIILEEWRRHWGWPDWTPDKKTLSLISKGKVGQHEITLLLPETFMNKSGKAVGVLVKTPAAATRLLVVHDDLDLPLGRAKLSFGRGDGGHKGVAAVKRVVKTKNFLRLRVGVAGQKKITDDDAVIKFILGHFTPAELSVVKKLALTGEDLVAVWASTGVEKTMSRFSARYFASGR